MKFRIFKPLYGLFPFAICLYFADWLFPTAARAASIVCRNISVLRTSVVVVKADVTCPRIRVTVELAKGGLGTSESFRSFLSRTKPVAAATGTLFCTRRLLPVADIVRNGKIVWRSPLGTALAFPSGSSPVILPGNRTRSALECYETVLATGPRLLASGRISLAPKAEGFRQMKLAAKHRRTAIGITRYGKLLLVAVPAPITLGRLSRIMLYLGCTDAVALDGGSSTGLAFNGRILVAPRRQLTNIIAIYLDGKSLALSVRGQPAVSKDRALSCAPARNGHPILTLQMIETPPKSANTEPSNHLCAAEGMLSQPARPVPPESREKRLS